MVALMISDALMLAVGFRLAYWIRFELGLDIFRLQVEASLEFYRGLVLFIIPLWLITYAAIGMYRMENLLGGPQEYSLVFRGTTLGLMLVLVAGFLEPTLVIARGWLLAAWIITFLLVSLGRFSLRRVVYILRRSGFFLSPALIVGTNPEAVSLYQQLTSWATSGLHVIGFVGVDQLDNAEPTGIPVLGSVDELDEILRRNEVEELILATSALSRDLMLSIFKNFGFEKRVNLRMSSGLFEIITTGLNVKEYAYVPLVGVNRVRLTGFNSALKTILDYGLTVPVLLIIWPLLLAIAVIVRLDSPGPVFHRRRVLGVNGTQFDAFKFRTMYVNGDEILDEHPELKSALSRNHKLKEDPRVTRVGAFLRRFSLDELPQLFNVLKREMSLVGPRMISPEEMSKYNQWGINLLTVCPGITGLWQVSGRSDVAYKERVRMDMHYIRNWTIWMDLQLLWQTIPAVLRGRGAY